jgi:hypothetical protein
VEYEPNGCNGCADKPKEHDFLKYDKAAAMRAFR